jgi:hypothetical protein
MTHERSSTLTLAGVFMVLAALAYGVSALTGLVSGGVYPTVLGGTTRINGIALFAGYAPLVPIALLLAGLILRERRPRLVWIGFAAWFVVAAADIVVLGGLVMAATVAASALVPLVLVLSGRQRSSMASLPDQPLPPESLDPETPRA